MAFVTLKVKIASGEGREVEMPGATSADYAAMRVADTFGFDSDDGRHVFLLVDSETMDPIPPDLVAAELEGRELTLQAHRR